MAKQVNLFAYYINTGDNMLMMDKAADGVMESFEHKDIGRGTNLITSERDIQWHVSEKDAPRAVEALEKVGFRAKISPLRAMTTDPSAHPELADEAASAFEHVTLVGDSDLPFPFSPSEPAN
ncbi:MAG: hypothetical protein JJ902_04150 [Roseibium sp.]|nr:hypothetical protein [Roseibium sp.]